ncbi:hypothetical protein E2C01_065266 [Portunus trituberculatus]|uniref:Uncharacterized protein n=1 Tax=Portunus trituberculatus TaxID=210409 RepID=A0A5B7HMJ0_PORTR|nr:hypothetical protein [Portunus trituberculatus]
MSEDMTLVAFDVIISVSSLGDPPVIVSASHGQPLETLFRIKNIYSRDEDKQSTDHSSPPSFGHNVSLASPVQPYQIRSSMEHRPAPPSLHPQISTSTSCH